MTKILQALCWLKKKKGLRSSFLGVLSCFNKSKQPESVLLINFPLWPQAGHTLIPEVNPKRKVADTGPATIPK